MKLYELKKGDVFFTTRKYSLPNTQKKCDTFICIKHYTDKNGNRKTKSLAVNYKHPELKYFDSNKDIIIKP